MRRTSGCGPQTTPRSWPNRWLVVKVLAPSLTDTGRSSGKKTSGWRNPRLAKVHHPYHDLAARWGEMEKATSGVAWAMLTKFCAVAKIHTQRHGLPPN